jgi:hypothetical protein
MAAKKVLKVPMLAPGIQEHFMKRLRQCLSPGIGLAEELADILDVSTDSAYRRIRGETELTIEEIYRITKKHAISIDEVFSNRGDTVTFNYTKLTDSEANFLAYLSRLHGHLSAMNKFGNRMIYYVAEEIPMFYSFYSRKLIEFKLFFWQRSVLNIDRYQHARFDWGMVPENLVDLAHQSYLQYMTVPSVEVWTEETVLTGLKQVRFYFESGLISRSQALDLLEDYRKMIEMVHVNAASGRKNVSDQSQNYTLYSSDVVLGTNCIYAIMGETKYSYISFNSINSLTTNNPEFCEETEHWIRNLEKKSTLISGVGEKQRYQFFSLMFKAIEEFTEKIRKTG